jgi:hypothetical protein
MAAPLNSPRLTELSQRRWEFTLYRAKRKIPSHLLLSHGEPQNHEFAMSAVSIVVPTKRDARQSIAGGLNKKRHPVLRPDASMESMLL